MTRTNKQKRKEEYVYSKKQIRNNGVCVTDQTDQSMSTRTINVVKIHYWIHSSVKSQ